LQGVSRALLGFPFVAGRYSSGNLWFHRFTAQLKTEADQGKDCWVPIGG
jgi:hypothetical protein